MFLDGIVTGEGLCFLIEAYRWFREVALYSIYFYVFVPEPSKLEQR